MRGGGGAIGVGWVVGVAALVWLGLSGCASVSPVLSGSGLRGVEGERAETELRVVSWNVGLGVFLDHSGRRLSRLSRGGWSVRNALSHQPLLRGFDVIGLQELCSHGDGAHLKVLARVFPYHRVFGRSDPRRRGECEKGEAIFSRYPLVRSGVIQLPPTRRVGRSAVWADVAVPVGSTTQVVRVYNVHLDNKGGLVSGSDGRWNQMQEVLAHYGRWRERNPGEAVIFLGDFNAMGGLYDPWTDERTIVEAKRVFRSAIAGFDYTWLALYQLDWIFYDAMELVEGQVVRVLLSDHYPVVATFRLTAPVGVESP